MNENIKNNDLSDYEVISCSDRCYKCHFKCEVVMDDVRKINFSCRHPKGPGNPVHCIYFRNNDGS